MLASVAKRGLRRGSARRRSGAGRTDADEEREGGGPSFPRKKRIIKAGRGAPPTVVSDRASPGIRDLRIRDRWVGFFVI